MEERVRVSSADARMGTFKVAGVTSANVLGPGVLGLFKEQTFMEHSSCTILES